MIRRRHDALFFHFFDEPCGAIIADAELALDPRDRRVARGRDDVHGLVVHIVVVLALRHLHPALVVVFFTRLDDVEVVDRATLCLQEVDDLVDLDFVDVAAV